MIHYLTVYLSFLATVNAFHSPHHLVPARCPPASFKKATTNVKVLGVNRFSHSTFSATALHGKLWKRLQIEEDDPGDGTSWYLINCVAGVELDLLNQCRHVCERFSETDVEKFVVPTERHLRSHGDKKKVVDVKVRYPGYVFCKIRLTEEVYETLQELELARSWMGTVNRKGHKKLPPAPLPLNVEEVKRFKGLEEAQEIFEDMYGGDYTGRTDAGADLLAQYAGYDVGQMVKVLRGNFEGEDGTVRRLKGGQLMVRMFTYGQTYDEWFDPDAIRPLTDLEVMRGMSGPTKPIDQDQFDVSIGKKDPSILEDPPGDGTGTGGRTSALRSGLLQSAGYGSSRNRREDRVARGETGNRDLFSRTPEEIKREEQNWLAYREERRAGKRGGGGGGRGETNTFARQTEARKQKEKGPPKGRDTWGIVERSSWTGGEYGFEADSEQEERERMRRTTEVYGDRVPRGRRPSRGGGRDPLDRRQGPRQDFNDDRRRESRRPMRQSSASAERGGGRAPFGVADGVDGEEDFFDSLMTELSEDLEDGGPGGRSRARGTHHHDNAGPNTRAMRVTGKDMGGAEDSFFENLMSELGGALNEKATSPSESAKSERKLDDDDFFSNLEAELSQSLGGEFDGDAEKMYGDSANNDDDFFANLQKEMGKALSDSIETEPETLEPADADDDFFANLQREMGMLDDTPELENDEDGFFASLEKEIGKGPDDSPEAEPEIFDPDDDDFFANLQREIGMLDDSPETDAETVDSADNEDDDFFGSLHTDMGKGLNSASSKKVDKAPKEEFIASLIVDVPDEIQSPVVGREAEAPQDNLFSSLIDHGAEDIQFPAVLSGGNEHTSSENNSNLASLTVPELKDMLRSKGLKVGGRKAELIERLRSH